MEQFANQFVKILYILIINDLLNKLYYLREHHKGGIHEDGAAFFRRFAAMFIRG